MKIERRALLVAVLLAAGCRGDRTNTPEPGGNEGEELPTHDMAEGPRGYPGELIPTQELEGQFMARQKLKIVFEEREFEFGAVLQIAEGKLTVLGLTPFGTKAFVLTQTGSEVEFEALLDREMPFPPEYILQDIHRTLLWGARLPWGAEGPEGGEGSVEVAGERVTERWSEAGLEQRSFERLDGQPAGVISVEYVGGHRPERPAKKVIMRNGWFGYDLTIQTTQWREL